MKQKCYQRLVRRRTETTARRTHRTWAKVPGAGNRLSPYENASIFCTCSVYICINISFLAFSRYTLSCLLENVLKSLILLPLAFAQCDAMERSDVQRQRAATKHLHGLEGTSPDVQDRALPLQLDWSNYLKDNERIFSGEVQLPCPFFVKSFTWIMAYRILQHPFTYPLPEFGENRTARGGRKPSKTFSSIKSHPGSEQALFSHPPEVIVICVCVCALLRWFVCYSVMWCSSTIFVSDFDFWVTDVAF